ncbi:MAG: alpha/beta hydrolase [Chlorobi bacterium]|nr:alpha/beta hydrolase [Chlorobiota bacterium]
MRKIIFLGALIGLIAFSCARLDSFLFNPYKTDEYKLDAYDGKLQFRLGPEFDIPQDKIHLFSISSQGYKIWGIYIGDTTTISSDTVILYCHGNTGHIDYYWQRAKLLAHVGGKLRYGVLIFDYRGYGKSEGEPSEEAIYEDTKAMMQWLKDKGLTGDRLVIYGYSMGTAPATYWSSHDGPLTPRWLILEAPFASAELMVQDGAYFVLPKQYVTDLEINNAEWIKNAKAPLLLFHGTEDKLLALDPHGKTVFDNHPGPKQAVFVEGATHSDVPVILGIEAYISEIYNFIKSH